MPKLFGRPLEDNDWIKVIMVESHADYDEIPYPSGPFWRSHPCHLAFIAHLFGLETADPRACRVLELGCASGGNLLPMAHDFPESTFLGVDLSKVQVDDAQKTIEALGLKNVRIEHRSITEVGPQDGVFDFIICHGVYSWVPPEVQTRILEIGRDQLSPTGVMYVSYNALPGWHLRGAVRDMMRYHVAQFPSPKDKIRQARLLLDFLIKGSASRAEAYNKLLQDEAKLLSSLSDSYLFHEHLETFNEPLYFHQFADRMKSVNLQYLGEADFNSMLSDRFPPDTSAALKEAPLMRQEQYMDFLRSRTFRSTLMCRTDVKLRRAVPADRIEAADVALERPATYESLTWDMEPNQFAAGPVKFGVRSTVTKAAMLVMSEEWPRRMPFPELLQKSLSKLRGETVDSATEEAHRQRLLSDLMDLMSGTVLRAGIHFPTLVSFVSEKPIATPIARVQAQRGPLAVNRWHENARLDPLGHCLVRRLDGTRDRAALVECLKQDHKDGLLKIKKQEEEVTSLADNDWMAAVETGLKNLAKTGLLVG